MDNNISAWLEDITRSIDEIIGEAVNRITNYKNAEIEIQNARQIIGTRNKVAHEYDNISDEIIWTIIVRELPKLKEEITKLRE